MELTEGKYRFVRMDYTDKFNVIDLSKKCLRCDKYFGETNCENCNGSSFEYLFEKERVICQKCDKSYYSWTCIECRCSNPYSKTIYKKYDLKQKDQLPQPKHTREVNWFENLDIIVIILGVIALIALLYFSFSYSKWLGIVIVIILFKLFIGN